MYLGESVKITVFGMMLIIIGTIMLNMPFNIGMTVAETELHPNIFPVVYWTFKIINPNKGAVPGEKLYFRVGITNLPNSTIPLHPRTAHLGYSESGYLVVRGWAWNFAWWRAVSVNETYEEVFGRFVLRDDPPIGSRVWGEMGVSVYDGQPSHIYPHFSIIIMPPLAVSTNVDLDLLNLQSKDRWITAYIELPQGYNINKVDVSTIHLNNTVSIDPEFAPVIGDHDNDTIPDMMVKFDRASVISYIRDEGVEYGNATLKITGRLTYNTVFEGKEINEIPFEGTDVVKVIDLLGDINSDGKVDVYDAVLVLAAYGSKPDDPNWNPNADIAPPYGTINLYDAVTMLVNYGKKYN